MHTPSAGELAHLHNTFLSQENRNEPLGHWREQRAAFNPALGSCRLHLSYCHLIYDVEKQANGFLCLFMILCEWVT